MNVPPNAASRAKELLCLGIVVGVRGLKGEVRIKSFTADPEDIAAYGDLRSEDGLRSYSLKVVGSHNGAVVARVVGIADRVAADRLKGEKLYVLRSALPEAGAGEYYHADLIGLAVERTDGVTVGRVAAVENFGSGDILDVAVPGKESVMVPFTAAAVAEVDMKAGVIRAIPVPGLFDDGGDERDDGSRDEGTNGGDRTQQKRKPNDQPRGQHRGQRRGE